MTIEEKARAYDEALERAKKYNIDDAHAYQGTIVKLIFPELAKSEDERIRKWLYDFIHNCPNETFEFYGGVGKDAVLNYLEKQKEQRQEWNEPQSEFKNINEAFEDGKKEVVAHPEKYGLCECVPAEWDEEDETHGAFILESLEDQIRFCKKDAEGAYRAKQIRTAQNWLKSLPERFVLQPNQEWSEEDEHRITDAIYFLESAKNHYADTSEIEKAIDWLNSLRSQSKKELSMEKAIRWLDDTFYFSDNSSGRGRDCEITTHDFDSLEEMHDSFRKAVIVDSEPFWKPTDEQIRTLDIVISDYRHACTKDSDKKAEILKPLLEQLEKL